MTAEMLADDDLDRWRGVKAEDHEEMPGSVSALLQRRTRRLLGDLLRPHRRAVRTVTLAIVLATAAQMAIPALVGFGIDRGLAHARAGHDGTVIAVFLAIVGCALLQGVLTRIFLLGSGRIGQDAVLELRRRAFVHFQELSLSFHERYTSGRMISR
ncbi:MAG: ABC transporter transmembrane domain-containing protein, partial [Mycobacteriales bacterium]